MTDENKLTLLRGLIRGSYNDDILLTYLNLAGQKIINRAYPFGKAPTIVPERYETLQCEIAAFMINKRGMEGQTSHSENGVSMGFENGDIPESLIGGVVPEVGIPT